MSMTSTKRRHDCVGSGWLASISGLVLVGLSACQPGGEDGLDTGTEDTTSTGSSSTDDSSTPSADTTDGSSTAASSTSVVDTGSSTTGADSFCGDGIVSGIEECDGTDLRGATCETLGLPGGMLACDVDCFYDHDGCVLMPSSPTLMLSVSAVKQFDFSWDAAPGVDYYRLEESIAPGEPFVQVGGDLVGESVSLTMPLHLRHQASYRLSACNPAGCAGSAEVPVMGSLAEAVGYFKAASGDPHDGLGHTVALSADGSTLAVGIPYEDSSATGIDGDDTDDSATDAGAVYVFVRDNTGAWAQQAYVKAFNTGASDHFGWSVALSDDGSTLAVGAEWESSNATGVDGNPANDLAPASGAAYVFVRDDMGAWSQQAYVKASNTDTYDYFGASVALSGDGNTLAVGAYYEDSSATGIDGNQAIDWMTNAGAVYVFVRDGAGDWSQAAYVKASNTDSDGFGRSVALSGDGQTLAVGAPGEDSKATGNDGNQNSDPAADFNAGAVYVFVVDGAGTWSQQAYVKASTSGQWDGFGASVALSDDGDTLAVGATGEASSATGIDGDQADDSAPSSGAVYVFVRDGMESWAQQAYIKASNTSGALDQFGWSVSLTNDGDMLVVAAHREDSSATGLGGDQANTLAPSSGAAYVLVRDGMGAWAQRAYVKASNAEEDDRFGTSVALSGDGDTLAVGAPREDSNATGIGGDQANDAVFNPGAVYLY